MCTKSVLLALGVSLALVGLSPTKTLGQQAYLPTKQGDSGYWLATNGANVSALSQANTWMRVPASGSANVWITRPGIGQGYYHTKIATAAPGTSWTPVQTSLANPGSGIFFGDPTLAKNITNWQKPSPPDVNWLTRGGVNGGFGVWSAGTSGLQNPTQSTWTPYTGPTMPPTMPPTGPTVINNTVCYPCTYSQPVYTPTYSRPVYTSTYYPR